jgi:hypothetical protein
MTNAKTFSFLSPTSRAIADLNNDTPLDIVVANAYINYANVLL